MREMKSSGIAWVGEMPEEWNIKRGKFTLELLNRPTEESDDVITCFRDGEVTLRKNRREDGFTVSLKEIGYQGLEPGDLVIHGMDGFAGAIGISDSRGKSSPVLVVCDSKENKKYIMYYLRSMAYNDVFTALATGIRVRSCDLRWNKLAELPYILPTIDEQNEIVHAIDKATSQVDILISNVKEQIEKLKAYKQSVITDVITKGLDPSVPMKDSGVDWIGEIPHNYAVIRMRYLIDNYKAGPFGSALITDQLLTEGSILCYTPEHIALQNTDNEKNLYLPEYRREEMSQFFVKAGDVIFPIVGSLGRAMVITEEMPDGIINQRLAKFTVNTKKIDIDYFMWLFARSSFFLPFIDLYQRGSIIVNLTKTIVYDMPFVIPPTLEEQRVIAKHLEEKCAKIDQLITVKQKKIDKLNEYKKSLIYECVTGKREVV